jgi:hypothetical protein
VLCLAQRGEEPGALEHLPVEVYRRLEPRRVVRPLPQAGVRRQVEAAPLRQLLQLVLVHRRRPPRRPPALIRVLAAVAGDVNQREIYGLKNGKERREESEVEWPERGSVIYIFFEFYVRSEFNALPAVTSVGRQPTMLLNFFV